MDGWIQLYNYTEVEWEKWPVDLQKMASDLLDELVNRIQESNVDLVAVSVLSFFQHTWTKEFLTKLKKVMPNVTTIAGGPGMSTVTHNEKINFGRWLVNQGILDYFVLGEGDEVFREFLQGNRDLLGLNSVDTLDSWQPQLDNINVFAFPTYKKIQKEDYTRNNHFYVSVTGSRGCVRNCSFCDVRSYWKKYKYRDATFIASEIQKHNREIGVENFSFNDSLINGSLKNFNSLIDKLSSLKKKYASLENLSIDGQFIIRSKNSHPESMYQKMSESGIRLLYTGVESGSYDVRVHMGKNFTDEDIDWHFEMCEKYQIKNNLLMLIGYPTETITDFELSMSMLKKYRKYVINKTIAQINVVHPMVLLPNTPLTELSDELMLEYDNLDIYKWVSHKNPELDLNERIRRVVLFASTAIDLGYRIPDRIKYFFESRLQQETTFKISSEIY
jgi:radical SAM superfamily enzyme YgiQ (UPF0313 family)